MKNIVSYLSFRGNCREVMNFYHTILGGELTLMTYGGQPLEVKDEDKHKIIHSSLSKNGNAVLMASDNDVFECDPQKDTCGNTSGNITLSVHCESESETKKYFEALAQGGNITIPLEKTFWAELFGMLTDKYGINWMFNYQKSGCGEKTSTKPENK